MKSETKIVICSHAFLKLNTGYIELWLVYCMTGLSNSSCQDDIGLIKLSRERSSLEIPHQSLFICRLLISSYNIITVANVKLQLLQLI